MAEARQATHEPQVSYMQEGTGDKGHITKVSKSLFQDLIECSYRTKKQFCNGLWPTTWDNLSAALTVFFLLMLIDHPSWSFISTNLWLLGAYLSLDDSYPYLFRIFLISLVSSILYFIAALYIRQNLLRILLSYKGWLYQPPKSQSFSVMVWAVLVKTVSRRKPRLYSYQRSLPRMNVPPLQPTVNKVLESLKPYLDKEEFQNMESDANDFLTTIGPKLQWVLHLKSWWSPNYYTDWWEKYVYLMSRDPLPINSNYYLHDQIKWLPTRHQTSRAAGVTSLILSFKSLLDTEDLEPLVLRNTIPLCMWQYQRMFSSARIPRTDCDILRHHPGSEHIAVYAKGHFYKVSVNDSHGKKLNVLDWETLFNWILVDAEVWTARSDAELRIAALTGNDRMSWAKCRREHFTSGINRDSIHAIEEAIIVVVLDDNEFSDIDERTKYSLHGSGSSLWFDKSITAVFYKDGRMALHCEHTWGDAPISGHLIEYFTLYEYLYRVYNDKGYCKPFVTPSNTSISRVPSKSVITPMRLYWDVNAELETCINEAYLFSLKNNEDIEMCVRAHTVYGKGFIKTTKNSPDAFMQMALQLAYHKDSGGLFAHTYEASMTRLYLQGRTETVRSLTSEVREFVLAMNDPSVPAKEKIHSMKLAAAAHQKLYRDAMSGKGVDRHLFALYVVCKGQGYNSPFLKNVLGMPWTLSTSQGGSQMNHGLDANVQEVRDAFAPGGGFGPVSDNGYGIGYMLVNDTDTYFHISAKKSCAATDAKRFMGNVFWALLQMKSAYDEVISS